VNLMTAVYVIAVTGALLVYRRLFHEARDELARLRGLCETETQAVRSEYAAYAHGITMAFASLIAGLAAASWHVPHQAARPGTNGESNEHQHRAG
jgi:hypothetical protein